jgi:hypothetical protein
LPEDEIRSQEKQTRKEKSSVMQGNLVVSAEAIVAHEGPKTYVSREEPSGLDMAMKPNGRANSVGA